LNETKQLLKVEKVKLIESAKLIEKTQEEATKDILKETETMQNELELHVKKLEERKKTHESLVKEYKEETKQAVRYLHVCLSKIVDHKSSVDEKLKEQVRLSEATLRKFQ